MGKIKLFRLLFLSGMIFLSFTARSQDISYFESQLSSIYSQIPESLSDEDEVDQLRNSCDIIISDIELFKKRNNDIFNNLIMRLNQIKSDSEKLVIFFYVIDRTNGMIEKNDFFKISKKAGGM